MTNTASSENRNEFCNFKHSKMNEMIAILKQGDNKKSMRELLKKLQQKKTAKGVDAKKYCGVIHLKEDALTIQKRLRNEWD